MIPYSQFRKLRLSHFVDTRKVSSLTDWEFLDRTWVGEAVGFSEWLRPKACPENMECLALDLRDLPEEVALSILSAIDLPLRPGMGLSEVEFVLGKPIDSQGFVADRRSFDFRLSGPERYEISCTLLNDVGLIYLVVTIPEYSER